MTSIKTLSSHKPILGRAAFLAVVVLAVFLSGCGDKKKDKVVSQIAAKVNKEEITVHQINFVLQQQRALPPEEAASASKQALERLIDQELAVQKAEDQKIDRDPRVLQQIEAARREIISRAYVERIGSGVTKPSPEEIKKYYDANPALFRERRIYNLQELAIEATPAQVEELRAKLQATKDVNEFVGFLNSGGYKFTGNQAVRPAERLPLSSLDKFAKLKDGQAVFNAMPNGAQVVVVAGSRSQPVDEEHARVAIEQFLLNERKRKIVEDDLKALRGAAHIEYVGDYVKGAAKPVQGTAEATPTKSPLVGEPAAAPAAPVPSATDAAASAAR